MYEETTAGVWRLQLRADAARVRAGRARVACVPLLVRWADSAPAAPRQAGSVARRAAAAKAIGAVGGGGGGEQRRGDVGAQEGGELRRRVGEQLRAHLVREWCSKGVAA